jgi:hypothetical protein
MNSCYFSTLHSIENSFSFCSRKFDYALTQEEITGLESTRYWVQKKEEGLIFFDSNTSFFSFLRSKCNDDDYCKKHINGDLLQSLGTILAKVNSTNRVFVFPIRYYDFME